MHDGRKQEHEEADEDDRVANSPVLPRTRGRVLVDVRADLRADDDGHEHAAHNQRADGRPARAREQARDKVRARPRPASDMV